MLDTYHDSGIELNRFDSTNYTEIPSRGQYVLHDVPVSSVGVVEYPNEDGTIRREFRPPEIVNSQRSRDSLAYAPFLSKIHTNHRMVSVDGRMTPAGGSTESLRDYACGTVLAPHTLKFDNNILTADILVEDAKAFQAIRNGLAYTSPGYNSRTVSIDTAIALGIQSVIDSPGVWEGKRYDSVQIEIVHNHVLQCNNPRQGRKMQIRLDENETSMPTPPIVDDQGKTLETPEQVNEYIDHLRGTNATLASQVKALRASGTAMQCRLDEFEDQEKKKEDKPVNLDSLTDDDKAKVMKSSMDDFELVSRVRTRHGLAPLELSALPKMKAAIAATIREVAKSNADEILARPPADHRLFLLACDSMPVNTSSKPTNPQKPDPALGGLTRTNNDSADPKPAPQTPNSPNWRDSAADQPLTLTKTR